MIELGKLYTEIRPPWSKFLMMVFARYYLPTATVVKEPKFVSPAEGRVYRTDLYLRDKRLLTYSEISRSDQFRGTSYERNIVLCEVWENDGCDGHVDYRQFGWRFVSHECLKLHDSRAPLPEPMELQPWDRV